MNIYPSSNHYIYMKVIIDQRIEGKTESLTLPNAELESTCVKIH